MKDQKIALGEQIAQEVLDGQIIGVGTGSTVTAAIEAIARRIEVENLEVKFIPTSLQSSWQLSSLGLTVLDFAADYQIDWSFDGVDAVDRQRRAIKGKGAAMLREKILAARSERYYLLADQTKITDDLLSHCSVPVEVIPAALSLAKTELRKLGTKSISLRAATAKHGPVITEAGNIILDVSFTKLTTELETLIKSIVGVVESGLFLNFATEVLLANDQNIERF